jgi:hypothetical protein
MFQTGNFHSELVKLCYSLIHKHFKNRIEKDKGTWLTNMCKTSRRKRLLLKSCFQSILELTMTYCVTEAFQMWPASFGCINEARYSNALPILSRWVSTSLS